MGLFSLLGGILGSSSPAKDLSSSSPAKDLSISVTVASRPQPEVSPAEVAERASQYAYVLAAELPSLKSADQWWSEKSNKRRLSDNSPKAYEWLEPFISRELVQSLQVPAVLERGPIAIDAAMKAIRVRIRERRKEKAPYEDLLAGLYGAAVLSDLFASLKTCFTGHMRMTEFVDINDLNGLLVEYHELGYQCLESLGKTDIKWLVEVCGEPAEHQSFASYCPHIHQKAISRLCWHELNRSNESAASLGWPTKSMQEWMNEALKRDIGYYKEWQEQMRVREQRQAELAEALDAAWAAADGPLVVADLETTGLDCENDEILEFGAVRIGPSGRVEAEFSMLVRIGAPVPLNITRLTGITQAMVDREGRPIAKAVNAFLEFAGGSPIFFHNAPFDTRFLKRAASTCNVRLANPIYDTLPMARSVWPRLGNYKLRTLASHVGARAAPEHRALSDVHATLAVLLAAREQSKMVA
jgi:DNA polymerase-3 subunit epsilon